MAFNLSVIHPLLPSRPASATVRAGVAAQNREASKVEELSEACARRSWGYTAFVAETTGAWGHAAQRTVRALVRASSLRSGEEPAQVATRMWRALSQAVASAVGRQLSKAHELSVSVNPGRPQPGAVTSSSSSSSSSFNQPSLGWGQPPHDLKPF